MVPQPYLKEAGTGKPNIFNVTGLALQIYLSGFY